MKVKRKETADLIPRRDLTVFDEMDRVFDTLMGQGWMHPLREMWPSALRAEERLATLPRMDVIDQETEILVRAEVPGVEKEHLDIEVAGHLLTLKGERKEEERIEEATYCHTEIRRGSFARSIRLPEEVNLDAARAEFKDGMLSIHLPKLEKTERRRIEVA